MDALVMCGGPGSRLDDEAEKPLVAVGGESMVERVIGALDGSDVDRIYAAVSPRAPDTAGVLDVPTIETPGDGYVADLRVALADERVARPVLTVAADLPLLESSAVDDVLAAHDRGSLTVAVPVERKRDRGLTVDASFDHDGRTVAPTGLNVVGEGPDRVHLADDERLAVNVNRPADLAVARRLA